jgi:hypothetical protein
VTGAGAGAGSRAQERGAALIIAVFALIIIEAIVGGIFFAARLEQQSGDNTLFLVQAAAAAETGLNLADVPPAALVPLVPEEAPLDLPALSAPGLVVERRVSRLMANLFLLRADAARRDAGGGVLAARPAGLLFELRADSTSGSSVLAPIARRAWVQLY